MINKQDRKIAALHNNQQDKTSRNFSIHSRSYTTDSKDTIIIIIIIMHIISIFATEESSTCLLTYMYIYHLHLLT